MPKEGIFSLFRRPTSAGHAKQKRASCFSSGMLLTLLGFGNALFNSGWSVPFGIFIGIVGISLLSQGILLFGYTER